MLPLTTPAAPNTRKKPHRVFSSTSQFDVCIVGAGIAGSALAWYLGRQGINVAVIERDFSEPDKIIGELLQPGGVIKLKELGYNEVLDGFDAQVIEGYALFMNDQHFQIPYPELNGSGLTGRGFRYGKFVSSLRESLYEIPSVTLIEGSVKQLIENKSDDTIQGIHYQSKGKNIIKSVFAQLTVICDGGFSKFRDELNGDKRQVKGYMLGLLLKDVGLPYPNHGHVFLGGPSPFLSYPVSSKETRVLIDFPGDQSPRKNANITDYLHKIIYRQLPKKMRPAFVAALEEDTFKAMPNMIVASKPTRKQGALLLGDSLNMRHPLTGGGMTVALTDVQLLGNLLFGMTSFRNKKPINAAVQEFHKRRHRSNATINILADALYDVMNYPDLKQACFHYLKKGGDHVKGPISILSAVSRSRQLLIRKFFAVAMFGGINLLQPFPSFKRIGRAYDLFRKAVRIISPLLMNENPSVVSRMLVKIGTYLFPENSKRELIV